MTQTNNVSLVHAGRSRREICAAVGAIGLLGPTAFIGASAYAQSSKAPVRSNFPLESRKQVALIIGNAEYRGNNQDSTSGEWRRLVNPVNDAYALSGKLREFRFDTEVEVNLTAAHIKAAVSHLVERASGATTVLFYFSGHGAGIGDTNYLIPIDARPVDADYASIKSDGVQLSDVIRPLMSIPAATKIVIIDACRSLPTTARFSGQKGSGYSGGLVSIPAPPNDTVIVFATDAGATADDAPDSKNGAYMQGLMHAFNYSQRLNLGAVLAETDRKVAELTDSRQIPKSYGRDSTKEDYWFKVDNFRSLPEADWGGRQGSEFASPRKL